MAANTVAALQHQHGFGVKFREIKLAAIETDCPEVVTYLSKV